MVVRIIQYPNGSANSIQTGAQGEERFRTYCIDNEISCYQPIITSRADFIIDLPEEGYVAVNVKTMSWHKTKKAYTVDFKTLCNGKYRPYKQGEIDYFVVVNIPYEKMWLLPVDAPRGKLQLNWHPPDKPHRKQHNSFNWEPYHIYSSKLGVIQNNLAKVR